MIHPDDADRLDHDLAGDGRNAAPIKKSARRSL
jgi:hypothetical protein